MKCFLCAQVIGNMVLHALADERDSVAYLQLTKQIGVQSHNHDLVKESSTSTENTQDAVDDLKGSLPLTLPFGVYVKNWGAQCNNVAGPRERLSSTTSASTCLAQCEAKQGKLCNYFMVGYDGKANSCWWNSDRRCETLLSDKYKLYMRLPEFEHKFTGQCEDPGLTGDEYEIRLSSTTDPEECRRQCIEKKGADCNYFILGFGSKGNSCWWQSDKLCETRKIADAYYLYGRNECDRFGYIDMGGGNCENSDQTRTPLCSEIISSGDGNAQCKEYCNKAADKCVGYNWRESDRNCMLSIDEGEITSTGLSSCGNPHWQGQNKLEVTDGGRYVTGNCYKRNDDGGYVYVGTGTCENSDKIRAPLCINIIHSGDGDAQCRDYCNEAGIKCKGYNWREYDKFCSLVIDQGDITSTGLTSCGNPHWQGQNIKLEVTVGGRHNLGVCYKKCG